MHLSPIYHFETRNIIIDNTNKLYEQLTLMYGNTYIENISIQTHS